MDILNSIHTWYLIVCLARMWDNWEHFAEGCLIQQRYRLTELLKIRRLAIRLTER